jgi:methylmalonyl-CoA/ethylmalonyl-CoA epimerase
MTTHLDHLAIGTPALTDGWELFGGLLGGTWAYGGDSPGYWWGQLEFATGPKIELLTPTGGPDAAFLERFLASRGAGPHHLNFLVSDITEALARTRAFGIEPVGVSLDHPRWKEAFLHPRQAHGIVIQLAQQEGSPVSPPPAGLPGPGPAAGFSLIEHHVGDLDGAVRLFRDVLEGQHSLDGQPGPARTETAGTASASTASASTGTAELTWPGGKRIRLVHEDGLPLGGALHHVSFTRTAGEFSAQDRERAGLLAKRLGVGLELGG